jgi:putative acetyltransferase
MDLRDVRDADSAAILALIGAIYSEYPKCVLVLDEVPDLLAPASSIAANNGRFWVLEEAGIVQATVAITPDPAGGGLFELTKVYVARDQRGRGFGRKLITLAEDEARARGATRIHLWTDTRFTTAHAVYERCGYTRLPGSRVLDDASESTEYHYEKRM